MHQVQRHLQPGTVVHMYLRAVRAGQVIRVKVALVLIFHLQHKAVVVHILRLQLQPILRLRPQVLEVQAILVEVVQVVTEVLVDIQVDRQVVVVAQVVVGVKYQS